jgi:hypothetical protein
LRAHVPSRPTWSPGFLSTARSRDPGETLPYPQQTMGLSPPKSVGEVRLPGYDWYTEDRLCPSPGRFSQRPRKQVPASPEGGTRRNMPVFCESALLNTTIRSDCIEERQVMRSIVAVIRSCWHGGVEALGAFTQIGAKSVQPYGSDGLLDEAGGLSSARCECFCASANCRLPSSRQRR